MNIHPKVGNEFPIWVHEQDGSVVSPVSPVFHACFSFLSSDLNSEAPGKDSVLHRARHCWERSSLALCPRGKTNTYLDISLLCPFFIPRAPAKSRRRRRDWSPRIILLTEAQPCFLSFHLNGLLPLSTHCSWLQHPEDPSDSGNP